MADCILCDEPVFGRSAARNQWMHRECALREVTGGIGHLIAHDYWCIERKDPDAGLTYRQSALLVDEFVVVVGVEGAVARGR
jgi:hypothetical protein